LLLAVTKYFIGGAPLFYPISFSHKKVYTTREHGADILEGGKVAFVRRKDRYEY